MKNLLLIFSVLLSTSLYAQIGPDGTGTVNGYYIGPGADLSGANLPFADLSNADLSSADLSGAILEFSNLINANLRDANLSGANLRDTILIYSDLSGADLTGANLLDARLIGANLKNADLSGANLPFADLSNANLSFAILDSALLSGADLRYADLSGADLYGATLTAADLSGTIWSNAISQSDYDAVVAERDAALAAQATAEAERDARPTQAAYDALVVERDAKLTLDEVKDLRAGSKMIEISNGEATISMEVEESDELGSWTISGNLSTNILLKAGEDKKFFRFKMNDSDFDLNDLTLSVGDIEYDETAIKAALAEQYDVPVESISLSVNSG